MEICLGERRISGLISVYGKAKGDVNTFRNSLGVELIFSLLC